MCDIVIGEEEKIYTYKAITLKRQAEREYDTEPGKESLEMLKNNKKNIVSAKPK